MNGEFNLPTSTCKHCGKAIQQMPSGEWLHENGMGNCGFTAEPVRE